MTRSRNDRHAVLRSSRSYYANRAYYRDLFDQRRRRDPGTDRELDFLEHAFRTHAQRRIERVLDVACGGGRHVVGLARRGYECVGQDFTRERVEMAKARAHRAQVSVRLKRADATRLRFVSEFDAVLALNILFLLPDDDDVQRCLRQIHRALRPAGFGGIHCYPDWERKPPKKPLADELVFVARKRIRKR